MLSSYEEISKKFKVGDKVKLINADGLMAKIGATAIVVGYLESNKDFGLYYIDINWIHDSLSGEQSDGGYYADVFEVVPTEEIIKNNCPRCNKELYDKQTEYCGTIKKCKSCGWC